MTKHAYEQIRKLNYANSLITSVYGQYAKKNDLSYNELTILYTIEETPGCTQKEICESWMIPKQTVNTILNEFKKKNYIKVEADRKDRREKLLFLTKEGHAFADCVLTALHELEVQTIVELGQEKAFQLIEIYNEFANIFDKKIKYMKDTQDRSNYE